MKINMFSRKSTLLWVLAGGVAGLSLLASGPAAAQIDMKKRPSLVITNKPVADVANSGASVYTGPVRAPDIAPSQVSGAGYYQPTQTLVAQKVNDLRSDLAALQARVNNLSGQMRSMQQRNLATSTEYNASVATINTQLQSGTTPGNPRLVEKLSVAQANLETLSQNVADLNAMAVEAANAASMGSFLLEACRSAYGLSGAVEEDHVALSQLEDQVNNTIVTIDRLLNEVNDDITRTAAYLSSERSNIRTLSLAVTNGDYYGRSLANRPFSNAPPTTLMVQPLGVVSAPLPPLSPSSPVSSSSPSGRLSPGTVVPAVQPAAESARPLVKIKFDQPNVDYQQAVYMAVNEAVQKYPNARFELVAVTPLNGNAAQVAIESTRARRNAEGVLRSIQQMGVDLNKIDLTTLQSPEARTNEVHLYLR